MELVTGYGLVCPVTIDGVEHKLLFDTWTDGMIAMTEEDFQKFSGKSGGKAMTGTGYGKANMETSTKVAGTCSFVKDNFSEVTVVEGKGLTRSMLGNDILDKGLVSLDFARQRVYFQPFDLMAVKDEVTETEVKIEPGEGEPDHAGVFPGAYFRLPEGRGVREQERQAGGDRFLGDVVRSLHEIAAVHGAVGGEVQGPDDFPEGGCGQGEGVVQYV